MTADLEAAVRRRLDRVLDPCSARNRTPLSVVEMGLVESVEVDDGRVTIGLLLTDPTCVFFFDMARAIEAEVASVPGVSQVEIENLTTTWWEPERIAPAARARLEWMRARRDASTTSTRELV